jgi:hypothetical protein
MELQNKREFRYMSVYEIDPDILFCQYSQNLDIDLEIARQLVQDRLDCSQGRPIYTLIDFTNVRSVSKEARDYMNSEEGGLKGIIAGAFISTNVVSTLFINLYLKISNPKVPAKFFTSFDEAFAWLRKLRDEPR